MDWTCRARIGSAMALAVVAALASLPCEATSSPAPATVAPGDARDAALYALGLIGITYRDGGDSPARGFDCSGLTRHVLAQARIADLPRTAREQGQTGQPVAREALRSGDLVFFDTQGSANSHVGIYVGDGRFVHAPGRGKEVTIANLGSPYWQRRYNGARRHSGAEPGSDTVAVSELPRWWTASQGPWTDSGLGNLPIAPEDVR